MVRGTKVGQTLICVSHKEIEAASLSYYDINAKVVSLIEMIYYYPAVLRYVENIKEKKARITWEYTYNIYIFL